MARLTLLAVPALLPRVDLEGTRSSSETGAAHPEAGFRRTSGTANTVSRATPSRATPVKQIGCGTVYSVSRACAADPRDLEAARWSPETVAVHPEAKFRRTSGTANKVSRATRRATLAAR